MSDLHVEIEGDGPNLVMLHGGGGQIGDLDDLRSLLRPGRRVISPDQRGHGRSPGGPDISYAAQARETSELLDELGIRNADLVGWSDGGIVGLLMARDRPDLVGRLVAISANAALDSKPPAVAGHVLEWVTTVKPSEIDMPSSRAKLPDAGAEWPTTAAQILEMWREGPHLSISDLTRISSRVLYIAADRDIVPLAHTVAMFEATRDARLAILPGADHHLPIKRAAEVAGLVDDFLTS